MRLKKKDWMMVAAGGVSLVALTGVIVAWAGPSGGIVVIAVGIAGLFAVQMELYRRLQRVIDDIAEGSQQLETLMSVVACLPLRAPLPRLRGWAISPDFAAVLVSTLLAERPGLVVELGSGSSTLLSGYCTERNERGRILSFDHDAEYAEQSRRSLSVHGLTEQATVIDAPLTDTEAGGMRFQWYDLAGLPEDAVIDVLIVDGPPIPMQPLSRYPALPLLLGRLSDNAVVLVDDARDPRIGEVVDRWQKEFPGFSVERVTAEKGVVILRRLPGGAATGTGSP